MSDISFLCARACVRLRVLYKDSKKKKKRKKNKKEKNEKEKKPENTNLIERKRVYKKITI
jgi:hypothetical protein